MHWKWLFAKKKKKMNMNIVKIVADIYKAGIIQSSIHGGGGGKALIYRRGKQKESKRSHTREKGCFCGGGVWGERTLRSFSRQLKTWNFWCHLAPFSMKDNGERMIKTPGKWDISLSWLRIRKRRKETWRRSLIVIHLSEVVQTAMVG